MSSTFKPSEQQPPQQQPPAKLAQKPLVKKDKIKYPFWFGGSASCFAACVTHPLDLVKVRLQTRAPTDPKTMVAMFSHIVRSSRGVIGLYDGLSAALLRQITYSTTRFGVYEELKARATVNNQAPGVGTLILLASSSGFAGGVVGNAADVLNVRMQHDASLPPAQRRNYKHALHGLVRMCRDEGPASLFRGVWPNSMRAALMTASQLASYDTFKQALIKHTPLGDTLSTHFAASFLAGFVATTICSPVDVVKTRIMSSTTAHQQGIVSLLRDIYRAEGVTWMFRGWVPSFIRLGPHTIATFVFLEQHKKMYRQLWDLDGEK